MSEIVLKCRAPSPKSCGKPRQNEGRKIAGTQAAGAESKGYRERMDGTEIHERGGILTGGGAPRLSVWTRGLCLLECMEFVEHPGDLSTLPSPKEWQGVGRGSFRRMGEGKKLGGTHAGNPIIEPICSKKACDALRKKKKEEVKRQSQQRQ